MHGTDLSIACGETVALLVSNGAGKSTTMLSASMDHHRRVLLSDRSWLAADRADASFRGDALVPRLVGGLASVAEAVAGAAAFVSRKRSSSPGCRTRVGAGASSMGRDYRRRARREHGHPGVPG
ncbi:MAG: hypothetical protein ACLP8S_27460 [Solirubrobacteraceae bacterium]